MRPQSDRALTAEQSATLVRAIMNDRQTKEFDASKECNFAISPPGIGRFRVSAFVQQGAVGAVIRLINAKIPSFEELDLPVILKEVAMSKRGLVMIVGGTGSGKSTLARGHDRPPQREHEASHRHHRRSGRVRASPQGLCDHAP